MILENIHTPDNVRLILENIHTPDNVPFIFENIYTWAYVPLILENIHTLANVPLILEHSHTPANVTYRKCYPIRSHSTDHRRSLVLSDGYQTTLLWVVRWPMEVTRSYHQVSNIFIIPLCYVTILSASPAVGYEPVLLLLR